MMIKLISILMRCDCLVGGMADGRQNFRLKSLVIYTIFVLRLINISWEARDIHLLPGKFNLR